MAEPRRGRRGATAGNGNAEEESSAEDGNGVNGDVSEDGSSGVESDEVDASDDNDGSSDGDGPILLAAEGRVFNVATARNFYGPGGEYHIMAGKDASRYLARNSVEEEPDAQASEPLNMAERAALAGWAWSFKQKYDAVGRLISEEEATARRAAENQRAAYLDKLEDLSSTEARDRLEELYES